MTGVYWFSVRIKWFFRKLTAPIRRPVRIALFVSIRIGAAYLFGFFLYGWFGQAVADPIETVDDISLPLIAYSAYIAAEYRAWRLRRTEPAVLDMQEQAERRAKRIPSGLLLGAAFLSGVLHAVLRDTA